MTTATADPNLVAKTSWRQRRSKAARFLRHPTVMTALVLLLAWGGFSVYQRVEAPDRITAELRELMAEQETIRNVEVVLGYRPEVFHLEYLSQFGTIAGATSEGLRLRNVDSEDVWPIARTYWVREVRVGRGREG